MVRAGLSEALAFMRGGDTLVVWRLDRLGRSLSQLINSVQDLEQRGVGFRSLQEAFDTTTPGGKLVFHVFGALAEFERGLIQQRTEAGLAAARERGRTGGRPSAMTPVQVQMAQNLRMDPTLSVKDICETLKVSEATLYRYTKSPRLLSTLGENEAVQ